MEEAVLEDVADSEVGMVEPGAGVSAVDMEVVGMAVLAVLAVLVVPVVHLKHKPLPIPSPTLLPVVVSEETSSSSEM